MGMLAAELDILAEKEQLPRYFSSIKSLALGGWIWRILLVAGLYLGGCPRGVQDVDKIAESDPGWWFISRLTPPVVEQVEWYWVSNPSLQPRCIHRSTAWLETC